MVSEESFKGVFVQRKFQKCFKEVLRIFTESFKGNLKGISRKIQVSFR